MTKHCLKMNSFMIMKKPKKIPFGIILAFVSTSCSRKAEQIWPFNFLKWSNSLIYFCTDFYIELEYYSLEGRREREEKKTKNKKNEKKNHNTVQLHLWSKFQDVFSILFTMYISWSSPQLRERLELKFFSFPHLSQHRIIES